MSLVDSFFHFSDPDYQQALLYAGLVVAFAVIEHADCKGWF